MDVRLLDVRYFIYNLGFPVSGVQYALENEMFGVSEELARTLAKERSQAVTCKGEYREWCLTECCRGVRHG